MTKSRMKARPPSQSSIPAEQPDPDVHEIDDSPEPVEATAAGDGADGGFADPFSPGFEKELEHALMADVLPDGQEHLGESYFAATEKGSQADVGHVPEGMASGMLPDPDGSRGRFWVCSQVAPQQTQTQLEVPLGQTQEQLDFPEDKARKCQ